eukprot:Gb_30013 [translate_table: standard]
MAQLLSALLCLVSLLNVSYQALAQPCLKSFSVNSSNKLFSSCKSLEQLNAEFAWTYEPNRGSIDMAFRARPDTPNGWVSWGINPGPTALMAGTRALIAFKHSNGSLLLLTYNVTEASKGAPLEPSQIDFKVDNLVAEFRDNEITMFATWNLLQNKTNVNHVWQTGGLVRGLVPQKHGFASANLQSKGVIDLKSGIASTSTTIPHHTLKNRHGVLNVVGWGILLPIGAMIARYLRSFKHADPAWFYLHAFCQTSGYILGVAGSAIGLKLGSYSKGIVFSQHRNIGISLFIVGTLQVLALLLRPKKRHKFRKYWNVYHHTIGYAVIVLSVVNIFKGFDILKPEDKWKRAYIGVISSLGGIAVALEIMSWIIFFRCKSKSSSKPFNGSKQPDAV